MFIHVRAKHYWNCASLTETVLFRPKAPFGLIGLFVLSEEKQEMNFAFSLKQSSVTGRDGAGKIKRFKLLSWPQQRRVETQIILLKVAFTFKKICAASASALNCCSYFCC